MIRDAKTLSANAVIEADLCIVGGGTTGIAMALEFKGTETRVCVLEGGDFELDKQTEALAAGENLGQHYHDLDRARPRYLGGGSNQWGGWCRPMDAIDFEQRDWVPYSGWPITRQTLDPFYARAAELCEIPNSSFEADDWAGSSPDLYRRPFATDDTPATVWVGSPPTKFGKVYRQALEDAPNIDLLTHANATELVTDPHGQTLTEVRAATLAGNRFSVRASVFVLVPGAIEAARLMLASRQGERQGIGNENDVVGRYFMEHPHVVTAKIRLFPRGETNRATIPALDYKFIRGGKARLMLERPTNGVKFAYTIKPELQRSERLLNYSAHLRTVAPSRESEGYRSLKLILGNLRSSKLLLKQIRQGAVPDGLGRQMKNLLLNPDDVFSIIYKQVLSRPKELELYTQSEQVPNPDSRVLLSDRTDELGVPRANLDWRLSLIDKVSIRHSQQIIGKRLEEAGLGRLESLPWVEADDEGWCRSMIGGYHHLGTTRMGTNPKESVVDENCRVHSVRNLFVTSTAAFPTGGYANPLLTGLALALRTADQVKAELSGVQLTTA